MEERDRRSSSRSPRVPIRSPRAPSQSPPVPPRSGRHGVAAIDPKTKWFYVDSSGSVYIACAQLGDLRLSGPLVAGPELVTEESL
ncbi:hypothetical protein PoB_003586100 [Plakobranchus ocellatus]|uniref:Uncharacterized protein n=1 Tax=Plakobranchus ocellatus TaxID=259542 RepID=A0AAV4ADT7_9GAST|nr:hypothetical protein PoB_003586100 [Plakobranchus ocellatus]